MEVVGSGPASSRTLKVGDKVKVRADVTSPKYSWGDAKPGMVGTVHRLDSDGDCIVDFPELSGYWTGVVSEMELVGSDGSAPKVGSKVRFKASVTSPRHGWASDRKHDDIGEVLSFDSDDDPVVKFPTKDRWVCARDDVEVVEESTGRRPAVGDKIRFKATVSSPRQGWASEKKHADVGEVIAFDEDGDAVVKFENHERWICAVDDIEVFEGGTPPSSSAIQPGVEVRIRAEVSTPKYGWGEAKHGMVGRVDRLDSDGDCVIKFPEIDGNWTAPPSELEIVRGDLKVGDKVKIRATVSTPQYDWGGASKEMVGTLARIDDDGDCFVDFPSLATFWRGRCAEIEIVP